MPLCKFFWYNNNNNKKETHKQLVTGFSDHGSCDGIEPLVVIFCTIPEIHLMVLAYLNAGSSANPSFHPDELGAVFIMQLRAELISF